MTFLKKPLSVWMVRIAFITAVAIVIPACGRSNPTVIVPFSITTTSVPSGVVNTGYQPTQLSTVSQTGAVTWSVLAGVLPPGLALDPLTGMITGTPTGSASSSIVLVRALDASGESSDAILFFTITGGAPGVLALTTTSPLPNGDQGVFYNFGFSAAAGTPPYAWSMTAGSLPPGVTLNPANGGLTGTPSTTGTFNFTIKVTDSAAATSSVAFALTIGSPIQITTTSLPDGTVGAAYNHSVVVTGGAPPLVYAVTSGTLPAGLVFNTATGAITGTPTTAAVSSFVVRVTDVADAQPAVSLSITINPPPTVVTSTLPTSTQGLAYNQTLIGTAGSGAYVWSVSAGALPTGLSLSAAGIITGTSTAAGTFNFTVLITDAAGGTGSRALSILINPPVVVTTAALAGWTVNRPG